MPFVLADLLGKYVFFLGRASRTEFWLCFLVFCILYFLIGVIDIEGFSYNSDQISRKKPAEDLGLGIRDLNNFNGFQVQVWPNFSIAWLIITIPFISVMCRRLHDTNRRAWFILLYLIPFFGVIGLLVLCSLKGTEGENRYGPDPILK